MRPIAKTVLLLTAAAILLALCPQAIAENEWRYDPAGKNDPFVTPPAPAPVDTPARYDLDQMALMGVIRGDGMEGAFIRFPDGADTIVRLGDVLGKHGGVVTVINPDHIVVEERYLSPQTAEVLVTIKRIYFYNTD